MRSLRAQRCLTLCACLCSLSCCSYWDQGAEKRAQVKGT